MTHHSSNNSIGLGLIAFIGGAITWALFGPKIKDRISRNSAFIELKADVEREVMEVKDLTRDKYNQIVEAVSSRYAKVQRISNNELKDLMDDLKTHWSKIKAAWDVDNPNRPDSNSQLSV